MVAASVASFGTPGDAISVTYGERGVARVAFRSVAFDPRVAAALTSVLDGLTADASVTAIVLAGEGADFLVGPSPKTLLAVRSAADAERIDASLSSAAERIAQMTKPVVAAVTGCAWGAGLGVALAAHAMAMSDSADSSLGLPDVTMGLVPSANAALRVAERVGLACALDLALSGRAVSANEALRLGLVDATCSASIVIDFATEMAVSLATRRSTKRAARRKVGLFARDANPFARHLALSRARERAEREVGVTAALRIVEVLEQHAKKGFARAAECETRAFGELVVSETGHRLMELALAEEEAKRERAAAGGGTESEVRKAAVALRLRDRCALEVKSLLDEGIAFEAIDDALTAWGYSAEGWRAAARASADEKKKASTASSDKKRRVLPEEIQMRFVLALVNEAVHALDAGAVDSPRDGDLAAVHALGFPRFRGGPFRYVDAVGAAEILRRVNGYRDRFGERWIASPRLVEIARRGRRFYE